MNFNIELAQQLLDSSEKFPVDFEKAWVWLGYKRKNNAKKSLLDAGFIENEDLLIQKQPTTTGIQANLNENIFLTIDCFKMWGMAAGTAKGKEIRKYFLECEKVAKQSIAQQPISTPDELPVIMPTEQELNYMQSRAWEKAEMMGVQVPAEKIKQRTGYRRAIDIVNDMKQKALNQTL